MLTAQQIKDLSKAKLEESRYSKNAKFLKLQYEAFKHYAILAENGYKEPTFQKELIRVESEILSKLETFAAYKDYNSEAAKNYHKESGLLDLEFKRTCLFVILEINPKKAA